MCCSGQSALGSVEYAGRKLGTWFPTTLRQVVDFSHYSLVQQASTVSPQPCLLASHVVDPHISVTGSREGTREASNTRPGGLWCCGRQHAFVAATPDDTLLLQGGPQQGSDPRKEPAPYTHTLLSHSWLLRHPPARITNLFPSPTIKCTFQDRIGPLSSAMHHLRLIEDAWAEAVGQKERGMVGRASVTTHAPKQMERGR